MEKKTNEESDKTALYIRRRPIIIKSGGFPLTEEREIDESAGKLLADNTLSVVVPLDYAIGVNTSTNDYVLTDKPGSHPTTEFAELEIQLIIDGVKIEPPITFKAGSFECSIVVSQKE